jgi:hypothetical protein
MEVSGQLQSQSLYPVFALNSRLGELQSLSQCREKDKNSVNQSSLLAAPSKLNRILYKTCRSISRKRPKYVHAATEEVWEEVFSMWSVPCQLLGNGR